MRERPILFQGDMIRALLAGTKSQTRRAIKPQPDTRPGMNCTRLIFKDRQGKPLLDEALETPGPSCYVSLCPYGEPGDRLWVREAWVPPHHTINPGVMTPQCYRATNPAPEMLRWKPSIHMPRWASRITLEVTDVRVQRLHDISHEDAEQEGVKCDMSALGFRDHYAALWDRINGRGSWAANPWVWAVSFELVQPS